jgi:hypothetical protein
MEETSSSPMLASPDASGFRARRLPDPGEMNGALRRKHFLQVLGDAEGADDFSFKKIANAGAGHRSRGTAVLFHCNLLHASGHNLTAEDRSHIYIYSCANAVLKAA